MASKKSRPTPVSTMRIQLQRDDDPAECDSRVLHPVPGAAEAWVTTAQVIAALDALLESPKLPGNERANARAARDAAVKWVLGRPPAGVTTAGARRGKSYVLDADRAYAGFRLDIENLRGHNLLS